MTLIANDGTPEGDALGYDLSQSRPITCAHKDCDHVIDDSCEDCYDNPEDWEGYYCEKCYTIWARTEDEDSNINQFKSVCEGI